MLRNPVEASSRTCSAKATVNANQGCPKPDASGDVACIMASTSRDHYAPGVDLGVVILRRGFGGEGPAQLLAAHSRSFSPRKRGFQDDNVWIAWRIESCTSVSLRSSAPADCLLCRGKTSSTDRDLPCVR